MTIIKFYIILSLIWRHFELIFFICILGFLPYVYIPYIVIKEMKDKKKKTKQKDPKNKVN